MVVGPHMRGICKSWRVHVKWDGVASPQYFFSLGSSLYGEARVVILWVPVSLAAFNLSQSQLGKSKKYTPYIREMAYLIP